MKTIKKIITFILLIIVLMISTLFMQFSFAKEVTFSEYGNVLSDSIDNLDAKIVDIAMLGAHDAFSNRINKKSEPNPNEDGIVHNKFVNAIGKGLVVRMSRAQTSMPENMLNAGVRYFDVRITKVEDDYYTCHGYLSDKLDLYIKDIVNFLETHTGEYVIIDIQHFYAEGNDNDNFNALFDYIRNIKGNNGTNLFDYVHYDSSIDQLRDLKYGKVVSNKSSAGVVIFAKTHNFNEIYYRDGDARYGISNYENVYSLWHEQNKSSTMLECIENEYNYLSENDFSNLLIINQAQKTGFIMDKRIIRSLFSWSIIDMAKNFNEVLVSDKDRFIKWLDKMPVFMVDNVTSSKSFVEKANEYINSFNQSL